MEIIELAGDDLRLYYLVGHLVMDEEVLKYNLNYPYKTSPEYRWFVAVDAGTTLGFVPAKLKNGKAALNNYYIADDDTAVLSALLKEAVRSLSPAFEVESVTQVRHIPVFSNFGFSIELTWKKYVRMKLYRT